MYVMYCIVCHVVSCHIMSCHVCMTDRCNYMERQSCLILVYYEMFIICLSLIHFYGLNLFLTDSAIR